MKLQQLSPDMFRLSSSKEVYLAIATKIKDESIDIDAPYTQHEQQGWIVRGKETFPWRHRPLCINETVHIIGPYLEGATLASRLDAGEASFGHINRLTRALQTLSQHGITLNAIHTQAIIFLHDGGMLFLANETVLLLCNYQGQREYAWNYQPFNHPKSEKYDYGNEERYSFALAALAYFTLCGKRPWDIEDNEEIKAHIMSGILPTLHFYDPYIRPEIANALHNVLGQPKLSPPPLTFWENFFHAYLIHGTHTKLNENEVRMRTRKANLLLNHLHKRHARKRRVKLSSFRFIGIMLFLFFVGIIPYALTQITIEQPKYRQLSAKEVVSSYYEGISQLDRAQVIQTLEADYTPSAIEQLDNIHRASRIGMIFRFQNPYLQPEFWIASGKRRLGGRYSVYGIDNLSLTEIARAENTVRIMAVYRYWLPLPLANDSRPQTISGNSVVETFQEEILLQKEKDRWVISSISPHID